MLYYSYYYNELRDEYTRITRKEMKEIVSAGDKLKEMEYRKHLYKSQDKKTQMVFRASGIAQGFARKGVMSGNKSSKTRGECESPTHQANKEAIAGLQECILSFNGTKVKIYVERAEMEKTVECNGREYEVDVFFKIKRTEPEEYCDLWNGELYLEVYHTCKVDIQKARDFNIAHKSLFEYKVYENLGVDFKLNDEQFEKRIIGIRNYLKKSGIKGFMICQTWNLVGDSWIYNTKTGNWFKEIEGVCYTIIKSKFDESYGILYDKRKPLWKYNEKKFGSVDEAKENAEYIAFELFNEKR